MSEDRVLAALERLEEDQKTIRDALGAITEILQMLSQDQAVLVDRVSLLSRQLQERMGREQRP